MSTKKKAIREAFREAVFRRDNYKCLLCGSEAVDAHHITDRNKMPNGGYVKENGASLCSDCHIKAEWGLEVTPDDLYARIHSSFVMAYRASEELS